MAVSESAARNFEFVLEDGTALDAFKRWMSEESARSKDPIDLYFAIKVFRNMIEQEDAKSAEIACKIHRRYISLRSGTCSFLPDAVRKEMSERVHALSSANPPRINLFDPCLEHLLAHLRKLHSVFLNSDVFHELLQDCVDLLEMPSTSYANPTQHSFGKFTTASTSSGGETARKPFKAAKPLKHFPLRCPPAVRTSKNDSAVSSSFSGDEGTRRSRRHNLQCENITHTIFSADGNRIRHERQEERERFAGKVREKLQKITDEIAKREKETGVEVFPRDLDKWQNSESWDAVSNGKGGEKADSVISDDDDSVDKYEQRMNANCEKSSAQREENRRSLSASPIRFTNRSADRSGGIANPYGENGFAPPPGGVHSQQRYNFAQTRIPHSLRSSTPLSSGGYGGHRLSDSSGFCSSESANIVNKAALFQKARLLASQDFPSSHTMTRRGPQMQTHAQHAIATLPRYDRFNNNLFLPSNQQLLTVSYKEQHGEAPFVAKMEMRDITFKEFRRNFGISSHAKKKFFFKSECEDGSAPYQWTIVDLDNTVLPVFEGRITGECRSCSESE